ncbi:MAG: hypothetical protein M1814_004561 [Vezdaea aestivalis]|nr:MAG: hypothetical protein M1814_004561 [Vezdaea aestivalis]
MSKTTPSHPELGQWADGPLQLLTTPLSTNPTSASVFVPCASEMAVVHNMIIRSFNSIVIQAPHFEPVDVVDFVNYALMWHLLVKKHYEGEEHMLFPELEKCIGVEANGIMDGNIEQHSRHAPHRGFPGWAQEYSRLSKSILEKPSSYSGEELVSIMSSYGKALQEHLVDEIPTLLALEKFGDKIPVRELNNKEGKAVMGALGVLTGLVFCLTVTDTTHENGLWKEFLPILPPIKWLLQNVFPLWHSSWWRFAPCTPSGQPRRMYAAPA